MNRRRIDRRLTDIDAAVAEIRELVSPRDVEVDAPPPSEPRSSEGNLGGIWGSSRVEVSIKGADLFPGNLVFKLESGSRSLRTYGDMGILASRTGDVTTVCLMAPFAGTGAQHYEALKIEIDGAVVVDDMRRDYVLPGRAKAFWNPDLAGEQYWGGTGSQYSVHAAPKLAQWIERGDGFRMVGDQEVWGPSNPNGGGGSMVYPNIGYWFDCADGRRMAHRLMWAFASRMPIFRYDREAWGRGELVHTSVDDRFGGYGGCGDDQIDGYRSTPDSSPLGQLSEKSLDHAHLGRVGGVTNHLSEWDSLDARMIRAAIVEDIRLKWLEPTVHGGRKPNLLKWSATDYKAQWPAHTGCKEAGRPFGHAMLFAAGGPPTASSVKVVDALVDLAGFFQRPDGAIYAIEPEASEYKKKIMAQGEAVPVGAGPLQVGFEEAITLRGLWAAERGDVFERCRDALGPRPPYVKFLDAPEYSFGESLWGHMMEPFCDPGGYSLMQLMLTNPTYDSAAAAACPELTP